MTGDPLSPPLPEAVREQIRTEMEHRCHHTLRLYANQLDNRGTDYPVMLLSQAIDVAEDVVRQAVERAVHQAREIAAEVERTRAPQAHPPPTPEEPK